MRISLDATDAGDAAGADIAGALRAVRELGCEVSLVGPAAELKRRLDSLRWDPADRRLEVVDAPETVGPAEDPERACREKPRSCVMVAGELVAQGRAQALVSAGPPGAAMTAALWHLKRLPGVLKPAIACPVSTLRGASVLIDAGASCDCKPWHLLQFAVMGSVYSQIVLGVQKPVVGLLSNAGEAPPSEAVREALSLLRYSGLEFRGLIRSGDVPAGGTDVVVCDGFVGSVCLDLMGAAAATFLGMRGVEAGTNPLYRLGGALLRPAERRLQERLSRQELGGASFMGVGAPVMLCQGAGAPAVFQAVRAALRLAEAGAEERLARGLEEIKDKLELAGV